MSIGNRIKELRDKMGLNQREFAHNVGEFEADHLRKMERGDIKEPKYAHIIAIGEYCNVSIDYILTGRDYTSQGMATNQSFVDMEELADTNLARNMFQTLHQLTTKVDTIAVGIKKFDRIGNEFDNLKALQGTASALSTNLQVRCALDDFRNCCSPVSKGLS